MKRILLFTIALALLHGLVFAQVNGDLSQVGGKWILKTWGTHQQRGYAQGYLLSQPIMQIFDEYLYQTVASSNPVAYNTLATFHADHFDIEAKYQQEAQGMIDGIVASGVSTYMTGLQRNLTYNDILLANSLVDLYFFQGQVNVNSNLKLDCASLSSWGTSTLADTTLNGNVIISRFMDWDRNAALISNPLLMISQPSEPEEQAWISFTYPGMIGALSAISASGKAAFLNTGNVHAYNNVNSLHPIILSVRNAIEQYDYNDDDLENINDIQAAVSSELHLAGTIVHAISQSPSVMTGVIESNNIEGTVMRTVLDNDNLPPGMHLAATNHFRSLTGIICCTRYGNIVDSLAANPDITPKRQLSLLAGAAGVENNLMSMQYTPETGRILWSTATSTEPAYNCDYYAFSINDLLDFSTPTEDESLSPRVPQMVVYPNPAHVKSTITIHNNDKSGTTLEIYNLKGQKVANLSGNAGIYMWKGITLNNKPAVPGIYFIKPEDKNSNTPAIKLLLLP